MSVLIPPDRCSTCKSNIKNPRNLVLFIDGTSNKPGSEKTNVKKLYDATCDDDTPELQQDKKYFEGIGAYDDLLPSIGSMISNGFDVALAWNIEKNVKEAYCWLATNYKKGDQIYLFGFSRGAYQVRALAGMVHEVGLLRDTNYQKRVEQAYRHYLSIDPKRPETRKLATEFKKDFCRPGVRIHFIGVWDTVSSLGLIKQDVHITASASVTNACHFRHALALDERRVKFMPEYFLEMNAHSSRNSKCAVTDVKEVWFAGCHGDVGGISRPHNEVVPNLVSDDDISPIHAGNVPLVWMEREAAAEGLAFQSKGFAWNPEDVDLGREDSMNLWWKLLEYLPIRHQVSFSGTGRDGLRWHLARPRLVIPSQYIHFSVLPGDVYTPRATLAHRVTIPTVPQKGSSELWKTELWGSELLDESTTTNLLKSIISDQQKTLNSLWEVLLLLDFRLDNCHSQKIPIPEWLEKSICSKQSSFEMFSLTVIYDTVSLSSTSNLEYSELVKGARDSLRHILSLDNQLYPPQVFYVVRFSAKHEKLRQHFIADDEVIEGLVRALQQTAKSTKENKNLFPLVIDSLCYLMQEESKREYIVDQLTTTCDKTPGEPTGLSLALEVNVPKHLMAALKMVATLAQSPSFMQKTDLCKTLKAKIAQLAKTRRGPVGSTAVETLLAFKETQNPVDDIHFFNVLGYLRETLPRLDAEVGSTSLPGTAVTQHHVSQAIDTEVPSSSSSDVAASPGPTIASQINDVETGDASLLDAAIPLPLVFRTNDSGQLDEEDTFMSKLLRTIESRDVDERTTATLTLLKLGRYSSILDFCSTKKVADTFVRQLERKETSLLAAYALNMFMKFKMWKPDEHTRASGSIKTMLDKGWFDDAVGRVEGFNIFRELMASDDLRRRVIEHGIVAILIKKLENGSHHEIRRSLICLDILVEGGKLDLESHVNTGLDYLSKDKNSQQKGVRILGALAQTEAGEQAIQSRVPDIVGMLLPPLKGLKTSHSLFGPAAALYELCKNETLRKQIKGSREYGDLKLLRLINHTGAPY